MMPAPDGIPWWNTVLGDDEALAAAEAVRTRRLSQGELTRRFEEEIARLVGAKFAVVTTSGTMALALAYWAAGLEPGDEILVPDRTFIATANAARMRGIRVRLVDVSSNDFTFDADSLERQVTSATKAVSVVHLNGRAADMERIRSIACAHGLRVIEDAAQAFYCPYRGRFLGTWGDVGCFSFGVTKLITTGQGGALVTDDSQLCERAARLRNHDRLDDAELRFDRVGLNLKFSDILAAIGLQQIAKVRAHRESCARQYAFFRGRLAGVRGVQMHDYGSDGGGPLWNEVWVDRRDEFVRFMADRGIQIRPLPLQLHQTEPYRQAGAFPASDIHARRAAYLPSGPAQTDADIERAADAMEVFLKGGGA